MALSCLLSIGLKLLSVITLSLTLSHATTINVLTRMYRPLFTPCLFVVCLVTGKVAQYMYTVHVHLFVYLYASVFVVVYQITDRQPGEGRKVVQEGCSCVNRTSVSSPPLSPYFMCPPVTAVTGSSQSSGQISNIL